MSEKILYEKGKVASNKKYLKKQFDTLIMSIYIL